MKYRKEIDGLRAIAILPVIFFHADIHGFSGGYVGVDIFFVISGYLITSIILEEQSQGKFSIVNFYERRARRILPALSVVLLSSSVAAYILMPTDYLKRYSQSLASVATFSSNIYFYLTSNYFDTETTEKPLLHTWSLAVEEQYYLFFPILMILIWCLGKKWMISIVIFLFFLSLLFAIYLSSQHIIEANFYLIFSRAWELFSGSILAFFSLPNSSISRWQAELLTTSGLVMICYAIVIFTNNTPFPSLFTLIPVTGTCLIIMFSHSSFIGRLLASKLLVSIGLISYSLYLWHQVIFAFLRLKFIGKPSLYIFAIAIIWVFFVAYFSWRYIEAPFRNKDTFSQFKIFVYSTVFIVCFISLGLIGNFLPLFDSRFNAPSYADSITSSPKRTECHTEGEYFLSPEHACEYFGNTINWASFGDSHTVEFSYALANDLKKQDVGLRQLSFSNCPPALLFEINTPGCNRWLKEALNYLEHSATIDHVVIGFRYTAFLYGSQLGSYPDLPNVSPANRMAAPFNKMDAEYLRELYWESLMTLIFRLLNAGKTVYVLYPIPELPVDIYKAVTPLSIFNSAPMLDLYQTSELAYYYKRNAFIIAKLNSLPYSEKLHAIKPTEAICDDKYCSAVKNNKALYFDDDHLSLTGAELVMNTLQYQ